MPCCLVVVSHDYPCVPLLPVWLSGGTGCREGSCQLEVSTRSLSPPGAATLCDVTEEVQSSAAELHNPDIAAANEKVIFVEPYDAGSRRNCWTSPQLDEDARRMQ